MKVKVLKSFGYAPDGIHPIFLNPGDIADIVDDIVNGLMDEGYCEKYWPDEKVINAPYEKKIIPTTRKMKK